MELGDVNKLVKNPESKDDALEAVDFIVNVLKEHEKDLDNLIGELATVTEELGKNGKLSDKVEKFEEKIENLQKEVTKLINLVSNLSGNVPKEALLTSVKEHVSDAACATPAMAIQSGHSLILQCKQWEDFQTLAFQPQTLSFSYKEDENGFQANALKGNQIITFSGALPKFSSILKTWLSEQLDVPEKNIFEGILAID
jgi:hypothetical protein